MYTAHNGNAEILSRLIQEDANVNAADKNGVTPLMYVADYSHLSPGVLRVLIENGTDVSVKDKQGRIALDYFESGLEKLHFSNSITLHDNKIQNDNFRFNTRILDGHAGCWS